MKKKHINNRSFWNKEYQEKKFLALSNKPSSDLIKFTKFLERISGKEYLNPICKVLDLGCGNGRNLIYLNQQYNVWGLGYDISQEAIDLAKKNSSAKIMYEVKSISEPIPLADESQTIVLDMMTSHFLNLKERQLLKKEISRILKPGGWLLFKTFLIEEDRHAKKLIKQRPAEETNSYIHPKIKVAEHVYTQKELEAELGTEFIIHKKIKSYRHLDKYNKANKRRSITIYAQKLDQERN